MQIQLNWDGGPDQYYMTTGLKLFPQATIYKVDQHPPWQWMVFDSNDRDEPHYQGECGTLDEAKRACENALLTKD